MLLINVIYTMKPGQREVFLKEVQAQGILEAVRREDGCMQYAYYLPAGGGRHPAAGRALAGLGGPAGPPGHPPYGRPGQAQGALRGPYPDRIRHRGGVTPSPG